MVHGGREGKTGGKAMEDYVFGKSVVDRGKTAFV